jgi:L-malate glycosyltransferase
MKVLLLSDTYSEHTEKWALGLAGEGVKIGLFSFNKASYEWYNHPNITVFFEPEKQINAERTLTKLSYLKYVTILKKIIRHFKPDLLHAHYATSYGLVAALSGFHPMVISVWGSDIYNFPKRSRLHRKVVQHNLKRADLILSTSEVMRRELAKYTQKDVIVTPFGVDTGIFRKKSVAKKKPGSIYVGTIKPIEEKYGISTIIDAAKILSEAADDIKYKFMLIGPGSDLAHYQRMIDDLSLTDKFEITGRIPFENISDYHNLLDIFVNVSVEDSESFGVAAVEAMACEKPVIVSDVGGLMEVVDNGKYGIVIKRDDATALAKAIAELASDNELAATYGKMGREHVLRHYDWKQNLAQMISEYEKLVTA